MRDVHEIDDVLQETLLRAAKYRGCQEDPARLRFWLLTIARNVLYDRSNRSARSMVTYGEEQSWVEVESRDASPAGSSGGEMFCVGSASFDHDQVMENLRETLTELSSTDQILLRSYYRDGASCTEIGNRLGLPARVIKVRLFRARKRLGLKMTRRLERTRRRSA